MKGYLAFQDYAIANWLHHFSAVVRAGQLLLAADSHVKDTIHDLECALDEFVSNYEDEILQDAVVNPSEEACEAFRGYNLYNSLQLVWSHICQHWEKGFKARDDVSLKYLSEALARNRRLLEDLPSSANYSFSNQEDLDSFYGDKRYKCPKLTCFYFHEGFKDFSSREKHINRHDRPFGCTFPDCEVAEFGFESSKDLGKHMRKFHPEANDQTDSFTSTRTEPAQAKEVCHVCDKRFTRRFALKNHIRSHKGERPHACSTCGKTFTRANDCTRHQKIHTRSHRSTTRVLHC
jgi:Zinc finger, C2H2 type